MYRRVIILLSTACLLSGAAPILGESAPVDPSRKEAEALLDHLGFLSHLVGRWEQQLAHPRAVRPDEAKLARLEEHLRELASATRTLDDAAAAFADRKREALLFDVRRLARGAPRLPVTQEPAARPTGMGIGDDRLEKATPQGSISGTLTRRSDGAPLASVPVRLRSVASSEFSKQFLTAEDGSFEFLELPDDFYFVGTRDLEGFLDHSWEGADCDFRSFECAETQARAARVHGGAAVVGVDLSLGPGSSISGRVTDSSSGLLVEGATVILYEESGSQVGRAITDAEGRYALHGLRVASYRLSVRHPEYASKLYSDLDCPGYCNPSDGDLLTVARDQNLGSIDFVLERLASIRGRVLSRGEPVAYEAVDVYEVDTGWVKGVRTDADGNYVAGGLQPGGYRVLTATYQYADELWNDVPCDGCSVVAGDTIVLADGEWAEGIDFDLEPMGSLRGRITATDGPLTEESMGRSVHAFDESGYWVSSRSVEPDGSYELPGLESGTYFLRVFIDGYRPEVWNDLPCWGSVWSPTCDVTSGDPLSVSIGVETEANFELFRLGAIAGRITDGSGNPLTDVTFEIYDSAGAGRSIYAPAVDADGNYHLPEIPSGTHYLVVRSPTHRDELWGGVPCENLACDPATGQGISVSLETTTENVDFSLARRGWIDGTVREAISGEVVTDGRAFLHDDSGSILSSDWLESGRFSFEGLAPADYRVSFRGEATHVAEVWPGSHCPATGCDPLAGNSISVADEAGATLDVSLERTSRIGGSISTSDGQPLEGGKIVIYDSNGAIFADVPTGTTAWSVDVLPPGTYSALLKSPSYRDRLWDGVDCEDSSACEPTSGTPISVGLEETITGIDFSLNRMSSLRARVIDSWNGNELSIWFTFVALYDEFGDLVQRLAYASEHEFPGLVAGSYYVEVTNSFEGYHRQVLGGAPCDPSCDPTTGTPIVISAAEHVEIDVPVDRGPGVRVRLVDGATGGAASGAGIDVWDEEGRPVTTSASDVSGWLTLNLEGGTYYLSTDNSAGLSHELWKDISCPGGSAWSGACDPLDGTPVVIDPYSPVQELTIILGEAQPPIFGDGFESGDLSAWSQNVGGVTIDSGTTE